MVFQNLEAAEVDRSQTGPKESAPETREVIAGVRALAARYLDSQMQRLCTVADDQLFNLSSRAGNGSLESDYFLAMRMIRRESGALKARYENAVLRRYGEFWKPNPSPAAFKSNSPKSMAAESPSTELSLMADETFEEALAVTTMAEKGKSIYQRVLHAIDQRFAHLSGRSGFESHENPLGPVFLCQCFAEALTPLPLDLEIKLLVYKLYDRVVLGALGNFYDEIDAYLIDAGVLPNQPRFTTRPRFPDREESRAPDAPDPLASGLDESQRACLELFESMQNLMDIWRIRMGLPLAYPAYNSPAPAIPMAEVINALSLLQRPSLLNAAAGEGLKTHVQRQAARLALGADERPLARREEDVIDMVSMLFDFILDDPNLPDLVKILIARLQIPVVKAAILEPSFFGRKNHPVRLLLNALAQAGIGLNMESGGKDNPAYKYIAALVDRILDEFDQDVSLFSQLLDEFMIFMEKESQRSRAAEERMLQANQGKERILLGKRKVAYEIAQRLQGKPVAAPVRSFLFNAWKDVMVLAYLRRDRAPADWEQSIQVMDQLIWSVTAPVTSATRKDLAETAAALIGSIRAGLEGLALDPQTIADALRDLRACHIARLSATGIDQEAMDEQKVQIRDPELVRAILEIRADLPDVESARVTDPTNADAVPDEFMAKAQALQVGQWVEFIEDGRRLRAKLAWKSQTTANYVFVNAKGAKATEISLAELAARFTESRARLIEVSSIPLMDRALQALVNTLQEPLNEAAVPAAG